LQMPFSRLITAVILITALLLQVTAAAHAVPGKKTIILNSGETKALVDTVPVELDVPPVIHSGHTLIPLRFVGEALETAVFWEAQTKTVTLGGPDTSVRLVVGASEAYVNERMLQLPAPARIQDGRTLVPLRFVSEALGAAVHFDATTKEITITVDLAGKTPPVAFFTLTPNPVRPGEEVTVRDESYHPEGVEIVERAWTGLGARYEPAGRYTVTLRVQDANGNWSVPHTSELIVNTPPVAGFRTEKESYKIGEPVAYINESLDPDGHVLTFLWTNQEPAFFEAGHHRVAFEVQDPLGGKDRFELVVPVSEEVHYTRTEYHLLYGEPKKVIPFEEKVLDFPVFALPAVSTARTLLRSNSPEDVPGPGLLYRDTVSGPGRLMVHHLNKTGGGLKIAVLAQNPGTEAARVTITRRGLSRPSTGILHQGREHLVHFFGAPSPAAIVIPPGKTVDLLPALSALTLRPGFCVTGLADFSTEAPVTFCVVAIPADADPLAVFPQLPVLPPDGLHVRGTFPMADRSIVVPESSPVNSRLVLGDTVHDVPLAGTDALTGEPVSNHGNYGVVYEILFERLGPGTAVLLNPRGGVYCGALRMNGLVWETPAEDYLKPQRQAVIIQRPVLPGTLRLEYTPPSGSYLPVNFLLVQLPENKEKP